MADMPSLKKKYIVSSSGYTDSAKRKAETHGVELLEIVDWSDPTKGFDFWNTGKENYEFSDIFFEWPVYNLNYNFDIKQPLSVSAPGSDYTQLCDENGESLPNIKVLKDTTPFIFNRVREEWGKNELSREMPIGVEVNLEQKRHRISRAGVFED